MTNNYTEIARQLIRSNVVGLKRRIHTDLHGADLKVLVGGVEALDDGIHQCISLEVHIGAHQLEEERREGDLEWDLPKIQHQLLDTCWLNLLHACH